MTGRNDLVALSASMTPNFSTVIKTQTFQRESVLFIGTQFSILYTSMYSPA